ncbi:unnamed protein product [Orchesella dallaii]|uniref:PAX-interacting protein 1 n=1 Tax=Orchesella dallaii TaxID=48710 RepID=A0ABP1PJ75_9HEXA
MVVEHHRDEGGSQLTVDGWKYSFFQKSPVQFPCLYPIAFLNGKMDKIPFPLDSLDDAELESLPKIFGDVKYCVEGNVDYKILKILDNGGAKHLNYATLSATHMIVGEGANEVKLNEAEEVFDMPTLQERWVVYSAKSGKLLPYHGFEAQPKKLFSSIVICTSGIKGEDLKTLWGLVTFHGGRFQKHLTQKTTHLFANTSEGVKYQAAKKNGIKVVCVDWASDCIKGGSLLNEQKYDPELLITKVESVATTDTNVTQQTAIGTPAQSRQPKVTQTGAVRAQTTTTNQTILQVQLSGNQSVNGPRVIREMAIRQPTPQQKMLIQQKQIQGGPTQVKAHQPLMVNTELEQAPKVPLLQLKSGPNVTTTTTQPAFTKSQVKPQSIKSTGQAQPPVQLQTLQRKPPISEQSQLPTQKSPGPQRSQMLQQQANVQQEPQPQLLQQPSPQIVQLPQPQPIQQLPPHSVQQKPPQPSQLPQLLQQQSQNQNQQHQPQLQLQQAPQFQHQQQPQVQQTQQQQATQIQQQIQIQQQSTLVQHTQTVMVQQQPGQVNQQQVQQQQQTQQHSVVLSQHQSVLQCQLQPQTQLQHQQLQQNMVLQNHQQQLLQHIQHHPNMQQPGSHPPTQGGIQGHQIILQQSAMQLQRQPPTQQGIPLHIHQKQRQQGIPQEQSLQKPQMTQFHQGGPLHQHEGMQFQHNQQLQQQLQNHQQLQGQPQQFVMPHQSKTLPQQLQSTSQHNQQIMKQQQIQAQGTIRPPQLSQQGQPQQGKQGRFQILQPKNRLQMKMDIPPKQSHQQVQQLTSSTPMQANPQKVFHQQEPHVQRSVAQTVKPPFPHSVQQQRPPSMMLSRQPLAQPQKSHPPIPPRQIGQPRHPSQPGLQTLPAQVGQKSSTQPVGQKPDFNQWSQQQQLEIFRQIQMDPNIKAKWNQMDHQQRALLIGKLVQRHREDQLRNQVMMRHQNQQTATQYQAKVQSQGQPITRQVASTSTDVQQVITGPNGQQHIMGTDGPILVQSHIPQAAQSPIQEPDKQMNLPPGNPAPQVAIIQDPPQLPGQQQSGTLWVSGNPPQRLGSPPQTTQFPLGIPQSSPEQQRSPGQPVCNVRQSPPVGQVASVRPGALAPSTAPYVNSYDAVGGTLTQPTSHVAISPALTPFYGYEPSFKAPPNGFLIGCVFWAAQPAGAFNWHHCVLFYGGEVLTEYNQSRVTHVICKNQKFPEFQQVLRHGKRLVTMHWLSDTCSRKVMAPPFYPMHLPLPFNDDNLPLKGQAFSQTGFEGEDRERVVKMLVLLGANYTPYFTKLNKGLVAGRTEGAKFSKAREWKTAVVNIQFLNELLLGNVSCIQEMMHAPKFQQYCVEQPFRFDINIAPHLMAAWKTPIRIPNVMVEKFKRTKRNLERTEEDLERVKQMKMAEDEVLQISYLDDLPPPPPMDGKEEENTKPDVETQPLPVIMFSGFSDKFKTLATDKVKSLGARITNDVKDATHLVIWEICTYKLYSALCRVKHIVSAAWVRDSYKANRFVDETAYTPSIPGFENFHKVPISDILKKPDRHILFKGMTFYLTPGLIGALKSGLEVIIEAAGGQVDRTNNSMADVKSKAKRNPRKYFIITNLDDFEYFSEFFYNKSNKTLSIFTAMFIYTCIVDQKVDLGVLPSEKSATKVEPPNRSNEVYLAD